MKDLSFINDIKCMAVIGTSAKRNFFFLKNHQESFKGPLYAINPTVKEIPGFPKENIYKSIKDVPEDVDFAFITVPAKQVISVIDECIEKGVKLVSIFSAEFSDAGTEEGKALEKELLKHADNKIRILGPNGMGLFYPKLGIAWRAFFPNTQGNIGLIAQSGGMCNIAIYTSIELGIHFSKVFSFGNGADLDFVDLFFYLSNDPETDVILLYIEGLKENRFDALREILSQNIKPIVALKGGKSSTGSKAVKTHTASISGNNKLWSALFKQYNVIEVESLEQLLYTAQIIDFYGVNEFKNVAIFSISGGYGVVLSDLIEKYGMKVSPFSNNIQLRLDKKFFINGTSSKNPLDVAAQMFHSHTLVDIVDTALLDDKIDTLIMDMPSWYFDPTYYLTRDTHFNENLEKVFKLGQKHHKPLFPIIQRAHCPEESHRIAKKLTKFKIAVFENPLEFIPLLPKISNMKKRIEKI
jgi:acyl-CoA synthetase (NDP forming)